MEAKAVESGYNVSLRLSPGLKGGGVAKRDFGEGLGNEFVRVQA